MDFEKTEGKRGAKANGGGDGAGEIDGKAADRSGSAPAEAGSGAAVGAGALARAKRTLELSRDDFRKIGDKQRNRRANAIGKTVSLLARAPTYQDMPLKDLEWFLMSNGAEHLTRIGVEELTTL